ncbi:MAG: leucine--tRNA ligase [Candidatus Andersenbacteria bacterium]
MPSYDPKAIESKWQKRWLDENIFAASDQAPKKKMYILDMFPYPSGDGLHVGHVKIYTASDVVSRYLRMKGFNVLHPTGWDAFGLPTENTAIKKGIQPSVLTAQNVTRFRQQMQQMGFSYDWNREVNTTDPEYYKWTQWIFLRMFQMGLAYQAHIPINWCPSCKTGLANEEVIDGKCDRCGTQVEEKPMRQWMLKITKYADQLLEGLGGLDWPKFVLDLQHNWIGRSEGAEISFGIDGTSNELSVFTTRPDTLFGATYVVVSPNHPLVAELTVPQQQAAVAAYVAEAQKPIRLDPKGEKEKSGVFTGSYAIHPVTNAKIPIWVADYVLMSYGSGAIMAVPAHDERDFAFAKKYNLPIQQVIVPAKAQGEATLPYIGDGVIINSEGFDGLSVTEAQRMILQKLQLQGKAKKAVQYKLRDWVFSRQRYWGEPIPIIHCEKCGVVPVPEKDLPVRLPEMDKYEPTGTGESPLATVEEWVNVKCPTCPRMAKRETNTMPQWAGSSWYWLRYVSPHYTQAFTDPAAMQKWLPVDVYVGGSEHAVLHLLYARFWQKALHAAGLVPQDEPFKRFRAVGLVIGEDGQKMSKSRGNVINPDDVVVQVGADALRVYEMFMGPFEASVAWNTSSIKGSRRFLDRMWDLVATRAAQASDQEDVEVELMLHQTIRHVSESTENFKFNTAISGLMELLNVVESKPMLSKKTLESIVLMLAPYAPHIAEELWEQLGHTQSLVYERWPSFNQKLLAKAQVTVPIQVNGKVRGQLQFDPGISQEEVEKRARALTNVQKHLEGKTVVKVIYVPDRLLNFVVK